MDKNTATADLERRRLLRAMLAAGLGVPALLQEASAQQLIPAAQGVRRMDGEVRVNGRPAGVGAAVRPGDTVTTGRDAYAMFVVGRDAYLLRENGRAEIAGKELFVDSLRLVTGKLLSVFGRSAQRRELASGAATIGIRGTGCYIGEPITARGYAPTSACATARRTSPQADAATRANCSPACTTRHRATSGAMAARRPSNAHRSSTTATANC